MKMTKVFVVAFFFFFFQAVSLFAISEENLKIAYLERFAMFIQWPTPIESYRICINNDDAFAKMLQESYSSRLFNNRPVTVTSFKIGDNQEEMMQCHILYFRGSKPNQNENFLNTLQKHNVLIISDEYDDTRKGAMIGFYLQDNKFRFVINQRNLKNAQLNISYKLLNFATVIEPTGN